MEGGVQALKYRKTIRQILLRQKIATTKKKIRQIPEYLNTESELDVMPKLHLCILRLVQITQK